ncbi:hypothetical protein SELMODRAFT_426661 [Selaginella moellendorffii]|uniref:Uncharacterized protein n=1 Tax=Selaginella moellendorffii TaxID=88036 RepID=D8SX35_SELML|nr:hypothetical protein SELMODRAFT_426661 [Selaginella moellendorffii]
MNTQIDVGVIEAVGTGASEAVGTGGGVLVSDVGGGGGAVPSVAEAVRGQVDEPAEDVIGSVVGGSTTEATGCMVAAPTAPQAGGARGASGGTGKAPEELIYNISKSKMSFAEQSVCLELLNTWLRNNEKRCEIRMEKVMKEKAYISQSIAAGEEMLQVWDEKFLSSTCTGNGWLPRGGTSSVEFKNQPGQPFLARRMVYRYLKYCPGAPVYTTGVLQKLLTRGKKLGMYEPEFYCPCTHERELCPSYLELVEQMPTSDFELDLYLECHPKALSDCDNDVVKVQQLNLGVSTQETIQEMPNSNTVEPEETVQEIPAQEIPAPAPRNPRRGRHEAFHENVAKSSHQSFRQTKTFFPSLPTATNDDLEELSFAAMHKQVRPLSPTASVGEVAVLIGDYTQLLDATSWELYMLDRWIHGLGQLTPYGKIDFIFFDLPDGMPPPQGDTPSWNVLQTKRLVHVEPIIYMSLWNTLNT